MKTLNFLKLILFYCSLLLWLPSVAQLKADAGEDLIVCNFDEEEFLIGGSPTTSGGIEPYTYTWSGRFLDADSIEYSAINASAILDDTTKSNPVIKIEDVPLNWYHLFLKVEDANGNVAYDSMKIVESAMDIQTIYIGPDTIFRGDSIQLIGDPYFDNNFVPLTYSISPSLGLTDPTDIYGWAKPDYSVTYYIQATNAIGCVSAKTQYWHIEVIDTTFTQNNKEILDSLNNLLIGEWKWYGSVGGFHGTGFGGPEENGYTVKIEIGKDLQSDSLFFWDYVNDTLVNEGKALLDFWQYNTTIYEIKNILPDVHYQAVAGPLAERMINIVFFNTDSVVFYSNMITDQYEVLYKRVESTEVNQQIITNSEIQFYPNPARHEITFENPNNLKIKKIEMIDISGRTIQSWSELIQQKNVLQIESVHRGIYLLKIETDFGIKTEKLLVQ